MKKKSMADKGSRGHTSAKPTGVRGKGAQAMEEVQLYSPLLDSSSKEFQRGPRLPCPIDSISEADMEGTVAVEATKKDRSKVLLSHDLLADQVWSF